MTGVNDVDIRPENEAAAKKARVRLVPGWFPAKIPLPAATYYGLSETAAEYVSNQPRALKLAYYFEVRAKTNEEKEAAAKSLCQAVGGLYHARRNQYADDFDANCYIKRISFIFTVFQSTLPEKGATKIGG